MLNPEQEFVNHLATDAALVIHREPIPESYLIIPQSKQIYAFVTNYITKKGTRPSKEVLETEFGPAFAEPKSDVDWVLNKLRDRYKKSQLFNLTIAVADKQDDPDAALSIIRERMGNIDRDTVSQRGSWNLQNDSGMFLDTLADKVLNQNAYKNYSVGFEEIDAFTGGLRPGQLGIIAARPKRMKTWIVQHAYKRQIEQGHNPVLFTLENTDEEILNRFQCIISGHSWDQAQRGNFDFKLLKQGWKDFMAQTKRQPFIVQPDPNERTVSRLIATADKLGADSIIISQLKWIESEQYHKNFFEKYNEIIMDLKKACLRPGREIPILLEAQLNREGQHVKEFLDMDLGQIGLTDAIGQVSDLIMGVVRTNEMIESNQLEYGIIEARNSDKKSWLIETELKKSTKFRLIPDV